MKVMCERFEQSAPKGYYVKMLGVDPANGCEWAGDSIPHYNVAPRLEARTLRVSGGKVHVKSRAWGYRTPQDAALKTPSWINARVEKALSGYYFRHMFREGRLIIPAGGWFEFTMESGRDCKQPWYITRKVDKPIFMAGITNFKLTGQSEDAGFVIVTLDEGVVDVQDRRPVGLDSADALRWMNPDTSVTEAVHVAQTRSLPAEEFIWWRVDRAVNQPDPSNNSRELLKPVSDLA
jgi:putative SOS response-associated peptidase YedK